MAKPVLRLLGLGLLGLGLLGLGLLGLRLARIRDVLMHLRRQMAI